MVRQSLNRAVCGEESSVMFIEGVPPLPCGIVCAVRPFNIHGPVSIIVISPWKYTDWRQALFVMPIRCKSIRNLPLKLYCVFLALCVVRTFLDAGRQVDAAEWLGLSGTWHVQVSMYSRASASNALRTSFFKVPRYPKSIYGKIKGSLRVLQIKT